MVKAKSSVPLTRTDAALLEAIAGHRTVSLRALIEQFDFENRAIPTFDEVSYGLVRLIARGYIRATWSQKRGIRLFSTRAGEDLRRAAGRYRRKTSRFKWPRIGEYPSAISHLVGAPAWPQPELEDRSFGRLPKLSEVEWNAAVRSYERWFDQWSKPILAFGRVFRWILIRLRPDDYR